MVGKELVINQWDLDVEKEKWDGYEKEEIWGVREVESVICAFVRELWGSGGAELGYWDQESEVVAEICWNCKVKWAISWKLQKPGSRTTNSPAKNLIRVGS